MVRKPLRVLLLLLAAFAVTTVLPAAANAADLEIVISATDTDEGAYTGTPPWDTTAGDGNDLSPGDDVVRTNDYVSFSWAMSVRNGPSPNTTITQTLEPGMEWEALPGFCRTDGTPVSSISADRLTIVCNLGSLGNVAQNYNVRAFAQGDTANGTTVDTSATIASSDAGTAAETSNPVGLEITAAPRVNLAKDMAPPTVYGGYRGGVWGHYVVFPMTLQIEAENGKGTKGAEMLVATNADPITFTDNLALGLSPDLILDGCGLGGFSALPNPNGGNASSVSRSGSISCVASGSGTAISIPSPAGTAPDLSGEHRPTQNSNGSPVPANTSYLGVYYIRFWIANADVPTEGLNVSNLLADFDPESVSGTSNFGTGSEPTDDNDAEAVVNRRDPVTGNLGINKWFSPVDTASTAWNDNQFIYPGTRFWAHVGTNLGGDDPVPANTVAICEIFDNTTYHLTMEGLSPGDVPAFLANPTTGVTATIEFGTGGDRGHTPDDWADTRSDDCNISDDGWEADPADLGVPLEEVSKVRMILSQPDNEIWPHGGWRNRLVLNVKARNTDLATDELLEQGTVLANFAKLSTDFASGNGSWSANNYNPETGGGSLGDRVVLARGAVRIAKDSVPPGLATIVGGDTATFQLKPTVTGYDLPSGVMRDVVVTDRISEYSDYVVGSASPTPDSVAANGDGTTTLTWNLGDLPVNDPVPAITYEVKYKLAIPNGAQSVNQTEISSPDDISQVQYRRDAHVVTTSRVSGILISKQTLTPWTEPGDDHIFQVEYANNSGSTQNWMATIDVLPYSGDSRGSGFNGELRLKDVQVSNGEDVYYTMRDPGDVVIYPKDPSNDLATGSTIWCLEADLGSIDCPAAIEESTAVMVRKATPTAVGEGFSYRIVLETEGNHSGDIYGNNAGVGASDATLETSSETMHDRVVASALGDYVWFDLNKNGIQDAGEAPVADVTVRLNGEDKMGRIVSLETTTGPDGLYRFDHLVSGDYEITFVAPAGHEFTAQRQGGDATLDSDAGPATGRTGPIVITSPIPLQADQEDMTWDAGIYEKTGTITIIKDASPDDPQGFGFSTSGGLNPAAFNLADNGGGPAARRAFTEVPSGVYTVTEGAVGGWNLSAVRCTGTAQTTVGLSDRSVSIDLGPGENASCTFVNEREATPAPPARTKPRPKPKPRPRPKPRIVLAKKASKSAVLPGGRVVYRVGIRNARRASVARNVRVCDRLPRMTSLVRAPGARLMKGRVCWTFKRIAFRPASKPIIRRVVVRVNRNARPGAKLVNVVRGPGGVKAIAPVRVKPRPGSGAAPVRGGGVTG